MLLHCKVVAVEDGCRFTDGRHRVAVQVEEADGTFNCFRLKAAELDVAHLGLGKRFALRAEVIEESADAPVEATF